MANLIVPKGLRLITSVFVKNFWPSIDRMSKLTLPILFISGRKDMLIPSSQMDKLFKYTQHSSYLKMYKVKNGEHNDTWTKEPEVYYREVKEFMDKAIKKNNAS
uniref:Alpha/beta hydrolase n=1 Tax=Euplotes harpa TaxID=151035 RepID=A0A7S3J759_9SPIT|mmetsp:Transcript_23737/g.27296  ORF Transcript_23737/g.27296 Transcript_23737/m.27296 type:complete len:104 (+) Transcript_23737:630-941(+)